MKIFRRVLSVLLSLLMIVTMLPLSLIETSATEIVPAINDLGILETDADIPEGLEYSISLYIEDEVVITGYTGTEPDLVIPSVIEGYPVTIIGASAFTECEILTSIELPEGIKSIVDYAFEECKNLKSIKIPSSLTSIGQGAFRYCESLESIEIPSGVEFLGEDAFFGCISLKSIKIPSSVTEINNFAFGECASLTDVYYEGTQEQWLGIDIAGYNECLTNADIYCADTLPEGLEYSISNGEATITGYTGTASKLVLPSVIEDCPVTVVGEWAFAGCTSIVSIKIPDSVSVISDNAFDYCESLVSVRIPDGVTSIGESAFSFCTNLKSIDLSQSVTNINSYSFAYCDALEKVTVDENNPVYDSRDNCNAIIETSTNTLVFGCQSTIIPDSVTCIGEYAFVSCAGLVSIEIPSSVTSLCKYAFGFCKNLESIELPSSVKTIGSNVFEGCESLKSIEFPDSLTCIEWSLFARCKSLKNIVIPDEVTTIKDYAFYYCEGLESVVIPSSVTSVNPYAFYSCNALTNVYFDGTREQWDAISLGSNNNCLTNATIHFAKNEAVPSVWKYDIDNGEVTITEYIGSETDLTIPAEIEGYPVTTIGDWAIAERENLVSVEIPTSVTKIGAWAFYNCERLESIEIPSSVTGIAESVFYGCQSLSSIEVAESNPVYDSRENSNAIIETATNKLIAGCKSTKIPASINTIEDYAFAGSENLTGINIPINVVCIEYHAFEGCFALADVYYEGTQEQWLGIDIAGYNECLVNATIHFVEPEVVPEGLEYKMTGGEVTITGYTGTATKLVIPSVIDGYPVTIIDAFAFEMCEGLVSVNIPSSVTGIGSFAFSYCKNLENIQIFSGVTSIGMGAFDGCKSLGSIEIPESVRTIGTWAFYGCDSLENIEIPSSVTSIGEGIFAECTSLAEITVDENNSVYDSRENCNAIIETASNTLVAGCKATAIPSGVEAIGDEAFSYCTGLTGIEIPEGITSIGEGAFDGCENLESIEIPESVTSIGGWAFCYCTSLAEIKIPSGVESIGNYAFVHCESLVSVEFPASVKTIGEKAFDYCDALAEVYFDGTQEEWNAISIAEGNDALKTAYSSILENSVLVIFKDDRANVILDIQYYSEGKEIIFPELPENEKYLAIAWSMTSQEIALVEVGQCITVTPVWEAKPPCATLTVNGGVVKTHGGMYGDKYVANVNIVVVPDEASGGMMFAYWVDANGHIKSYDAEYKFYLSPYEEAELTAVFVELDTPIEYQAIANIAVDNYESGRIIWRMSWDVPSQVGEFVEGGLLTVESLYYNEETFVADTEDPNVIRAVPAKGQVAKQPGYALAKANVEEGTMWYGVTWVRYKDEKTGETVTVYSDLLSVAMGETQPPTEPPTEVPEEYTVYFVNSDGWSQVFAYVWEPSVSSDWPGVEMTKTGEIAPSGAYVYSITYDKNYVNILFHNFASEGYAQTGDLSFEAGKYYDITTDKWYNSLEELPTEPPTEEPVEMITIYFTNSNEWQNVFLFSSDFAEAEWPGIQMELFGLNSYGQGVYRCTIPENVTRITFNDGDTFETQEVTQGIGNNICFYPLNADNTEVGYGEIDPLDLTPADSVYFLCGSFNNWSFNKPMTQREDGSWVAEFELEKGIYEYKVASVDWDEFYPVSQNVSVKADVAGVYTFILNPDKSVSYIGPDAYTPEQIVNVIAIGEIGKVSLSWSESSEVKTSSYRIYRKAEDEGEYSLVKTINNRNTLTFEDTNVEKNKTYSYYVTGVGLYDIESEPSLFSTTTVLSDVTAPTVLKISPADKSVIWGNTNVSATTTDNIGVTRIKYFYSGDNGENWVLIGETTGGKIAFNTSQFTDETVKVKVVAYDAEGNESAPLINTYTVDNLGPDKITGLDAVALSSKLTLSWNDVEANDASYFVLQKKNGESWTGVASNIKTLGYIVSNLTPDTEYIFRVACVDTRGNVGEYSDEFAVRTLADTTAPVITSQSPAPARYNSTIKFSATAKDDCDINTIEIQTSSDAQNFTTISTKTFTSRAGQQSYTYTIDLSDYAEGSLYVRAIARDFTGNISDESDKAPYTEYFVDRTAPEKPANVTANGNEGYITIAWTVGSETDLGKYSVYRATSIDGTYTQIASNLATINYHDRNVQENTEYFYKVKVSDTCGNVSDYSDVVSATMAPDSQNPVITGISTTNSQKISNSMHTVNVTANDNNKLSYLVVECSTSKNMGYSELARYSSINNSYKNVSVSLPVEGLSDGDVVYLRAYCVDMAGLRSVYATSSYTVDNTPPLVQNLTSTVSGTTITLSWNDGRESDLSGFKVYRSADGVNYRLLGSRGAKSSGQYTFIDTVSSSVSSVYTYKVEAVDKVGNISSESVEAEYTYIYVNTAPVAEADVPAYMTVGVEEVFDATGSSDNMSIISYQWDFGDGTSSDISAPVKKYTEVGTYIVTMTVTDNEGLSTSVTKTVEVKEREVLGTLNVKVADDTGKALSYVPVYFDLGSDTQKIVHTNASGVATLQMSSGTHTIGMYAAGYLPVKKDVVVLANATRTVTLTTVEEEIVTGNFEITRMTFDEIVAAGINVYDPANQNVYSATVRVTYASSKQPIKINYVRNDSQILDYKVTDTNGNPITYYTNNNGEKRKITGVTFIPGGSGGKSDVVAIMDVPAEASYLKEFFDVRLHIVNNASTEFVLENNEVVLQVPEGLTVMTDLEGGYQESNIAHFDSIKGQQTVTLSWVLRGDLAGEYDLSADFTGTLAEFNELVTARFETEEPIKVYGLEGVKFRILVADEIHNDTLYFNVELENERDIDINMPSIGFTEKIENVTGSALNKNVKEDYFTEAYILNAYIQSGDGEKFYLPVSVDSNGKTSVPVEVLVPGQKLVYEYVAYNAINYLGVAYFKEAAITEFKGILDNIEVGSFHKERYSFNDYSEKLDNILSGNLDGVNYAYEYIIFDHNYYYENEAQSTGISICQAAYKTASVLLNLDLSVFKQEEKRDLIQQTILTVLSDSSVIYEAENRVDIEYAKAVKIMLEQVKTGLISQESCDTKSTAAAITAIGKESAALAKIYRTEGKKAFQAELYKKLSAYSLGITVDALSAIEQIDDEMAFSTAIGKGQNFFKNLLGALEESEKESYFYSVIKTQCNADISNAILDAIIEIDKSSLVTSVAKDMKKQLNNNMDVYYDGLNVIANMAETAAKDFIKGKLKIMLKKGLGSTPVIVITAAFNILDAVFGFNSYVKQQDAFDVYSVLADTFLEAFDESVQTRDPENDRYSMLYLRALCEIRLNGETRFKTFMDEYIDGVYYTRVEEKTILKWINKVKNSKFDDYDEWWDDVQYRLVSSIDTLFNEETLSDITIPRAPVVSLDYEKLETVQTFSSDYEYCFADGEWEPCTGDTIKFNVNVVPGTLRVRKAASADSLAGQIKTVKIFARKDLSKLITVKFDTNTYLLDNLSPNRNYQVAFVNAADEVVDWTTARTVYGSDTTVKIYGVREYDYVVIRSGQNSSLEETTSNPLVRTVQKKHTLDLVIEGSGTVSQSSKSGAYFKGEAVELEATASEGYVFVGWYINNQCASTDSFYIAEMDTELSVTAKFTGATVTSLAVEELPQKLTYHEGEELDLNGIKVVATYDDGTTAEIADYIAIITSAVPGKSLVEVRFGDVATSFEITIEHDRSDWIIVNDATPGFDGYKYKACYVCYSVLEEETLHVESLDFSGASLTLSDNIAVNYKVKKALFEETGYTNPYVVFTFNGVETTVSEYTVSGDKYVFTFSDIAPNQVKDIVNATLYATYDGEEYASVTRPYSVAEYCYSMLDTYSADEHSEFRTLLVDLLNYASVSQQYTGYMTDDLANAELTDAQKLWGTAETPELSTVLDTKYETVENPTAKWQGAGLLLNDAVSMRLKFATDSIENLNVRVRTSNGEWTIPSDEFVEGNGGYYVYVNNLDAGQMRETVYVTICDGDTAVSDTAAYSIESYAYEKQESSISYLAELVKAMMKYGDAAYAYVH